MPLPDNKELMMHKAEKKYEVGKVTDEEQAKQRQLKAILNKLTPQNFEKLFEQVKAVNIDNAATLTGVLSQIFDVAVMEPISCEMYADFCCHLAGELPDFNEDNEKVTFKRVLLKKCQEEFERGEREQEEANKVDEEGEIKQTAEEREEKRVKARRRMLGNIRLIGELYKKKMLTERIMHACIQKLLGQYEDPDEEDLEALCKLMSTIGEMIDHQKAKENMDAYFGRMKTLSNNMNLSSRVRFMLKDAIDLRKNKWQQRRKVEGLKKIEQVHRDTAKERHVQFNRLGHASSKNQPARRAPMDFGPRGSMKLSSPNAQVDGYQRLSDEADNKELMMHKAEKKYEVGKVVDEEEAKQRQLRAILNKLTPTNFDKLFEQVKAVNIDNAATLTGVVSQIFDRTLMEPIYCEMYVNFCCHLAGELPDFNEDNEKVTFKRVLLKKCQEEFERGEREREEETNKAGEEGEIKQTAEEREEKRVKARRRMLGNIRLIGELYKKKMLTERLMHACTQKLLGQYEDPDEEDVEALCKLMSTIGEMIDHQKAKENMDAYFGIMKTLSNNMNLSSRVRFMLKDAVDLRKNKWQQRRKVEGPKKIEQVHRVTAKERLVQFSGLAHASSKNQSARRAPMDFGPRGSMKLSSPNAQMDGYQRLSNEAASVSNDKPSLDLSKGKSTVKGGKKKRKKIASPQTPLLVVHKAKKYEVCKVVDEEEAKQRQLRAILNKLTPTKFEKLFEQVKAVNIDNAATLTGVVSQIVNRALMEPIYCEMYVNFCCRLAREFPDLYEGNEKITFKRVLLNMCQWEFERGEIEQEEEANKADEEGEIKQSAEEREEKRVKVRRQMLGNIRLTGELYKKKMLTKRIMHACIQKLLGQYQDPDEEDVEALCKLMSTIGEMIDHRKAKEHMDAYFERMKTLSNNTNLSSRIRFMLKDVIDLRKNKWQQRRKVEGPKKIEEVQRDAAQERAQVSRLGRALSINQSARRVPMEFAPRRSTMLSSPNAQIGSYRGLPTRGYGTLSERTTYGTREDLNPRNILDRFAAPAAYDQLSPQERNVTLGNRELRNVDRSFDRSLATSSPARGQGAAFPQNVPSEKAWPEERLRDMSMAAIKEFYSARDEKEVELCIKDLNSPNFHPLMVSLWVTDSFERKDMEQDVLAKLLVNLAKSRDGVLSQAHLIKGFESVLTTLEDAVNDAPRAPEFLGRIFAKVVTENVIPLREIGTLIHEGGEEPGRLRDLGLAADVLGSILEMIKSEKGDSVLSEILTSSNLRLEDFRPLDPNRSRKLRNVDRSFDRSLATSSTARGQGAAFPQNVPSEKAWPEGRLRDMSMAAIKEFYSARDEKEVELCIKDLNSPNFHPLMVSLWVTDSFERKDMERDVLAKLLVNLAKSRDGVLSQAHLIKGFESVLTTLEDAVNDAPRAPEFLGRIFAKVVTENVIPLGEIGMLIHAGGEEPGRLRDLGLAADVLGSILEMIKSEKGDSVLSEIRTSSNLRLEDFRPLDPNRSRKLENFI